MSKTIAKNLIKRFSFRIDYSILLNMNDFKTTNDINDIKQNFTDIYKNTKLGIILQKSLFPKKLSELKIYHRTQKTTLEREFIWTALLINNNRDKINEYLMFKKDYEFYLFIGEYHQALNILNLIKSTLDIHFG